MNDSDGDDEVEAVILDNGSCTFKAGFSGEDAPIVQFPSLVGKPRFPSQQTDMKSAYVGDEALKHRGLSIRYPIEHGIVRNWDDMELLYDYAFQSMGVSPEEHAVLCTEPSLNAAGEREKKCQLMFERFGVPAFYVANSGILALIAKGRCPGLEINCGKDVTHWLPVYESSYCLKEAIGRVDIGGEDVTRYLATLLRERGYSFSTAAELHMVREMKEKLCFISQDVEQDLMSAKLSNKFDEQYTFPDGQTITLGKERFLACEVLFKPSLVGKSEPGLHECVKSCVDNCAIDTRREFIENISISGGPTLTRGMTERLQLEFEKMFPPKWIRVIASPERAHSVWIGGSIMTSLSWFKQKWISKQEYEEHGPSIVHRKC